MITRRHSLMLLGSALATPALGQSLRRAELPEWVHLTRIIGQDWQNRAARSLFFSRPNNQIIGAAWGIKTKQVTELFFLPDPDSREMERLFRMYEVRGEAELDSNPSRIEEFVWPSRTRLIETVWTSFFDSADATWDRLHAEDNPDRQNLELPNYSPIIWVMPTNDEPLPDQKPDLDFSAMTEEDTHPLRPIIEGMLEANTPFASSALKVQDIRIGLDQTKGIWLAKLAPTGGRPLYTHAYFRVFRANIN